ncbi:IclR family transcriptional regulator [Sporolactobacillus shoreicorticis]|uniref:IclR family transcriptional regulator n=1 Tax=Sporolactobacillus shoreicorticis TaxID=1923877 RepID=A0ABW5S2A3_9BACL|nr:IclR family transcriptional regulator [Sporolactobacillus shoreicorticis]MCO7124671.1 IclR family transcriptional regulator [Sporolactobacillus shoreicorticis]
MTENKPYGTVILRAKQILDFLEHEDQPVNLQKIYTSLNTSKSTVLKILNTLCMIDFVKREEGTKRYTLGTKLISYGEAAKKSFSVISIAEPYLIELNEKIGETVHLGVYDRDQIIYIKKLNAKSRIILRSQVGHSVDLYCSAMGKAYLAEQDEAEILSYLDRVKIVKKARNTICDKEHLLQELQMTRQRGYASDDQENEDDIFCVAVALKSSQALEGLISVSSPLFRLSDEKKEQIIERLKETKQQIEQKLNR